MEELSRQKSEGIMSLLGSGQLNGQTKNSSFSGSLDETECHQSKENLSNGNIPPKAVRNIPRRHTVGGPRSSKEILGMQTSDMDRKREAFLEHLKYKYPHHATAIMGHQERLREQAAQCMLASFYSELDIQRYLMKIESSRRTKSPKLSSSPQSSLGDPAEHNLSEPLLDSGDAMFEGESTLPFIRGSRTRASLPVVRSTNQTKERSLGVLFLQYGEDTKKLQMPNEITGVDTIRALFVSAFPQQLTMKVLESPSTAIYIKDDGRNIYYELSDVRNIQDRSFLKVYHKDPAQAFNHTPRAVNGDVRMQRDIAYSVREGPAVHRPGSATYPSHGGPISPPPTPVPHSMPPSPSRIPYGGRPLVGQSNTTIQRERISSLPVSRSISPSPSAILERRDVKPDEDLGGKNVQLMRNDGMYVDPYMYHEGRMSIASSHGGHPMDMPDHLIAFHRGAMRSSSTYSNSSMQMEMMEQSVYRQKSRKHSDSLLPTLGSKTPPASPHRVTDIRMMEMHGHNAHVPPHGIQSERSSPIRQSFKKEQGPGVFVEAKVRNTGGIIGMADIVPSPTEKQVFGGYGVPHVAQKEIYTRDRMHAMEKQIASLTGLVQTALMKGPSPSSSKDAPGEKVIKSASSTPPITDSPVHTISSGKNILSIIESTAVSHAPPAGSEMQVSLHNMRRNVAELRLQLHKMKQLQLQNQEMVRAMMKKAELEISSKVTDIVRNLEDPVQRQRVLVEQERQKYLQDEEQIVIKLSDLENFVEKDSASRVVTLKDVEDRAFVLRQIGEAVSNLKGEFPYLQNKMRAVLRVEVEAVRFLKEEPHKLDSLLKRIRSMTDALSSLRRQVSDGPSKVVDFNQNNQFIITEKVTETDITQHREEKSHAYLQPTQTEAVNVTESQTVSVKSEVVPLSAGVKVHQVQSSPVHMRQSQHSSALINHVHNSINQTGHGTEVSANYHSTSLPAHAAQELSPAVQTTQHNGSSAQSLFIEEIQHVAYRNRAVSIEEAERKFEEKRQNLDHYNGKEFEKMLEEAQANIMKSIPSLEIPAQSLKVDSGEKLEVIEGNKEIEQESDKLIKSPPPPPPRRIYPPGSGMSTSWGSEWRDSKDSEEVLPSKEAEIPRGSSAVTTVMSSAVKDEEEEEGERIMAELQAFQKCSIVEINSKVQYEPPKSETQERDFKPPGLALPKEKKVSCTISKESLRPESPKLVESTEDKWRFHFQSSAPDSAKHRQENKVVVNEQSTYSLFIGRDEHKNNEEQKELKGEEHTTIISYPKNQVLNQLSAPVLPEVGNGRIEHKTESSRSTIVKVSNVEKVLENQEPSKALQEQGMPYLDLGQRVVLRQKNSRRTVSQPSEDTDHPAISPTSPNEPKSPADNIAFMITNTEVQVLSTGEVQDIVNRKGSEFQTVNLDRENVEKVNLNTSTNAGSEDPVVSTDKKPVIIIFDEPMDIRSAYKRLSTIFEEGDDDLEKIMSGATIDEEEEEEEEEEKEPDAPAPQHKVDLNKTKTTTENVKDQSRYRFNYPSLAEMKQTMFNDGTSQTILTDEDRSDVSDYQFGQRQDVKKKFKFKFPKKQLAALTQAIRTGTKTGKKTLQVVVYEDEEELDGTVKQHKEAKRFEIARSSSKEENTNPALEKLEVHSLAESDQVSRTDEIRQNTYRTLDSLEQTIKQLESTMSEMTPRPGSDITEIKETKTFSQSPVLAKEHVLVEETKLVIESPSSLPISARKGSNGAPQTSRMPIPMSSKSRQGTPEKTSKQPKLQEPQRQYRQNANGRPSPAATASSSSAAASPSTSVSPTSLTQGMKSIRTIHTPSFTSYKSQNGISSKITTPKEAS
ncbi:sickle tail protein homolog isoform X4 [Rana temporaria]|uniref:sickle tail protein homolog isoform X4 n=1 Tax=Rana temporaria TaxID=8407 RepID=UPI001AAC85E6|nr:sickle tail protein homolog isoform X4 [Rana temporaria]